MRVLIVGAAGSLGRQLAPELTGHGHEVVCFDLKPLEGTPYRWIAGDARVPQEMVEAAQACEAVAHLPAWHGIHLRHRSRRDFWELNVDGAFNAFEAAKVAGARKLLFCSTMGVEPSDCFSVTACSVQLPLAKRLNPFASVWFVSWHWGSGTKPNLSP